MADRELRQHVVSRVLLGRWAVGGFVTAFDLEHGTARRRPPRRECFIKGLLQHEPEAAEARWNAVEMRMPDVFASLDAGDVFDDPNTVAQLKDFFALHFARSLTVFDVFDASRVRSLEQFPRDPDLRDGRRLDEIFEDLTGVVPAGPAARLYALEEMLRRIDAKIGRGSEFFSERIDAHFTRIREELDGWGLQIGVAESGSFIIGDDPVQTIDTESGRVGILSGVTLREADVLLLPLGPRHVVSAAKEDGWLPVQLPGVRRLNRVQILAARRKVYLMPGDENTEDDVRALWDEFRDVQLGHA